MPVLAQRRVENWVLIRDWEGEEGWIHRTALSARRTVIVTGALRELRYAARTDAPLVARVQGGVIGRFERCEGDWCRADFQGYTGWIRRNEIWGVSDQD
jgi:SH3-like domain-containing protein